MWGFVGLRVLKLYKYLIVVHTRIEKLEMATAGFVSNLKKAMSIEIAIPPPPMPATVHRAMMKPKTKMPTISSGSYGKTSLCSHKLLTQSK